MDTNVTLGDRGLSIPTDEGINGLMASTNITMPVYINIRTLIRNAVSAHAGTPVTSEELNNVFEQVQQDILLLTHLLVSGMKVEMHFYTFTDTEYRKVKEIKYLTLKTPKTPRQCEIEDAEQAVLTAVLPKVHLSPLPTDSSILVMTHETRDLLIVDRGSILVESHTGKLRPSNEWSGKLNAPKADYAILPFNYITLAIYGDGKSVIGFAGKVKKDLIAVAEKYRWSSSTTVDRTLFCVKDNGGILLDLVNGIH